MKKFIVLIGLVLTFSSCGVTKKTSKQNTTTQEKIETKKDSSSNLETNKAIKDEAIISIAESNTGDKDFDEAVDKAVTKILRSINFQKSSGDNSYKLYYDEQLKQIKAQVEIAATQNKEVKTNNETKEQYSVVSELKEEIKKIKVPIWVYALVIFFFRKQIIGIIAIFFPAVKGITSIQDLLTPPNKDN